MALLKVTTKTIERLLGIRNILIPFSRKRHLWTANNIVKSPFEDMLIPNRTVPEQIWENLDRWADKTAIICSTTRQSYTYHQLYKYSINLAAKLRKHFKIRDKDVVCIMMPNSPDYAVASLGILQAGAIVTTLNPIYTAHEVHKQLSLSNPRLIIAVPETVKVIKEALILAKTHIPIMVCRNNNESLPAGTISFEEFTLDSNTDKNVLREVNSNYDDIAFLPYSSGTTGLPKGVELTHRNVVANCVQQNIDGYKLYDDTTGVNQDSILAILPFYHIYGLSVVMLHKLSVGLKLVTLPKFQPNNFISALQDYGITLLVAAPPIILFLASYPGVQKEQLQSLKTITNGAAPLPEMDIIKVLEKHKVDFLQLYGLTETSPLVTAALPGSNAYTTAGFAISNTELRVVDSNMRNLGPNEPGELLVKGPQVMKGYKDNPEATKEAIIEEGWFRTGDQAKLGEDGAVTICDRLKELIKVKGYQVPPAELESVLKNYPNVLDAAVIGIPDSRYGEVPKAFIVVNDKFKVDIKYVLEFVSERVAEYKRIKHIMVIDEIPKNPSGKILRRILKEKYGKA